MDQETAYRRSVEGWTARVEAVGPDQWALPTPCADWDVRTLVNHVVGEDLWTGPLMRGETMEEVGDRFDGDQLGELLAGITAGQHVQHGFQRAAAEGGERRRLAEQFEHLVDRDRLHRTDRDDLLREHVKGVPH